VKALLQDEEGAFTEIYERFFQPLYITAYRILQHAEGAEDAVQETFFSLWKYRDSLQIENLGGYLHQSVRYAVIKAYQRQQVDARFMERLAKASDILLREDPLLYKELQEKLQQTIGSLPPGHRRIFEMSREQEMTYGQIAGKLDISVKTVEKKMSWSLKQLRIAFGRTIKLFLLLIALWWLFFLA
jgi:RNA polymerase sigma-70 factor (ECF subfamily)